MNFYPPDTYLPHHNLTNQGAPKLTDPSISVEGDITQQKSLATEHREVSGDYVQSFVIVNDIDVEEELTKAKKETANNNFFKVLSMSFYGKIKSHSLEHQDSRLTHKTPTTPQGGLKSMIPRKTGTHTPPESKRTPTVKGLPKQKTQESIKKNEIPIKNLQLISEQVRTRLTSPKDESIKVYSPVVAGRNYQVGNFTGNKALTAMSKKETTFSIESQARTQTAKKRSTGEENKLVPSQNVKTSQTGRSNSPKGNYKGTNSYKGPRTQQRILESAEERTRTLDIEPSTLDIRPQEAEILYDNIDKEVAGPRSTVTGGKESRVTSKQSSREGSAKVIKDKPVNVTVNSGRNVGPITPTKLKVGLREGLDLKAPFFDQDTSKTNIISTGDKTPNTPNKDVKKFDLAGRDNNNNKKVISTGKPNKGQKAGSGDGKKEVNSVEKLRYMGIVDLQDSDNEEESRIEEKNKRSLNQLDNNNNKKMTGNYKADRQQKSPATVKLYERIPTAMNSGIGNWAIEPVLMTRESTTTKDKNKRGNASPEHKSPNGQATNNTNNANNVNHNKKSAPSTQILKDPPKVRKNNSAEKPQKVDVYDQWKGKKFEFGDQTKNVYTPKQDISKQGQQKEEKSQKFFDQQQTTTTPTKPKETTGEKARQTSPIPIDNRRPMGLLDKLLAQKKGVREKF